MTKNLTGMQVLTKNFTSYKIRYKSLSKTNQLSPLIHREINLIKFIESDKFDNVYSKT